MPFATQLNPTFEIPEGWTFGLPAREKKPTFSAAIKITAHDDCRHPQDCAKSFARFVSSGQNANWIVECKMIPSSHVYGAASLELTLGGWLHDVFDSQEEAFNFVRGRAEYFLKYAEHRIASTAEVSEPTVLEKEKF